MEGYKTYIVFGLILLNELAAAIGWSVSLSDLPDDLSQWVLPVVSLLGLVLRTVTKSPPAFRFLGLGYKK